MNSPVSSLYMSLFLETSSTVAPKYPLHAHHLRTHISHVPIEDQSLGAFRMDVIRNVSLAAIDENARCLLPKEHSM